MTPVFRFDSRSLAILAVASGLFSLAGPMEAQDIGPMATVPAGTTISIRTNDRVDTRRSDGQVFGGAVSQQITDKSGRVIVPRGAHAEFTVRNLSDRSLVLDLESLDVNGVRYAVTTSSIRAGGLAGRRSLVGSIADVLAGGDQGTAATGGPGAGRGFQLFGSGRNIRIAAEAVLTFRLVQPLIFSGPKMAR